MELTMDSPERLCSKTAPKYFTESLQKIFRHQRHGSALHLPIGIYPENVSPCSSDADLVCWRKEFIHLWTFFSLLQNRPQNQDPSYKMDLDFWVCFGRKTSHIIAELCKTDLAVWNHFGWGREGVLKPNKYCNCTQFMATFINYYNYRNDPKISDTWKSDNNYSEILRKWILHMLMHPNNA